MDEEKQTIIPISSVEEKDKRVRWVSCCIETDGRAVVYFGQLTFSILVLFFCCGMLLTSNGECNKSSPYISIISFLLGKLLSNVVDSKNA